MASTAVISTAVARVLGIKTTFQDLKPGGLLLLPQRVVIVGQGTTAATYPDTKQIITKATQAGELYGFGSPIHLAVKQLLPVDGDGIGSIPLTVLPLEDDGSGVVSTGDITPSGSATEAASFQVKIGGILSAQFVIGVGDSVATMVTAIFAAIQAVIDMPMIAVDGTTVVDVTSKWKGASANGINIEIIGPTDVGVSFAITQPAGGLVNPDVDPALALIGDVWETLVLNCMDVTDTGTLTKYTTFGEGRWGALTRKPLVVFSGETRADQATAIIIPSARKTDRINAQIVAPGSSDIPFVVAARALARIAVRANADPAFDFGGLPLTGISPGTDGEQWDYNERDGAVKVGSSTAEVRDGVVVMADTVTFYHPDGEEPPAYRYVVDIMKLMNILFTLDLIFVKPEWDGAPLIPDDDPTVNPNAKRPKDAVAAIASALDGLGLNAIISDPPTAKASIVAGINVSNPKRLDIELTVQLSGNTNIISIDNNFGFFFGTPAIL